jgi:type III pantothenate kinase
MNLKIDIGNRRVKWTDQHLDWQQSHVDDKSPVSVSRVAETGLRSLGDVLNDQFGELQTPEAIWISCVSAPPLRTEIGAVCESLWQATPRFIEIQAGNFELDVGYRKPSTLGVDRWIAMVAGRRLVGPRPFVVIDAGTAVTLDFVDANGKFNGGIIFPGLLTMIESLNSNTGNIRVGVTPGTTADASWVNTSTEAAVASGATLSVVSTVDCGIDHHLSCCSEEPQILVTGGDAEMIKSMSRHDMQHQPDLVLAGIQIVGEKLLA